MQPELYLSYPSAFLIGLLGSTHCLGMCGGISASLSMALPVGKGFRARQSLMLLSFNLGRIASYTGIATLIALLSTHAAASWASVGLVLRSLAGLLLVFMGLSMAQWWQGIRYVERLGAPVWRRLAPAARALMPVRRPWQALALGAVWGWLPCGLVYSTLGWAALQPTTASAALTMFFFGLGTLPSMFATGYAAQWIQGLQKQQGFRRASGVLLILFGLWTLPLPWPGS
ncbi:sulfite exporter TauE/SafE family protein [Marinobacter lutaoensis]|jgi:sulfite exporter TauE/SafE|uniref:Cytochrome biogenesis protein n=1 Tax=Marinobacter lutaoensis TaxID=135739 RepID=A0A1V2DY27_9GAMM|nr:sulfite exporter TauE/SafE family protein [Marinobacter lutaoensis]MBI42637.1 sulfite exporter TauE/SafE family protein [Oceanospirillales bacterium]NVD35356.1 sulfite exporter TauE/SafE family protein [Marinobacter lutaoensis]ONF45316.1 cytochrome biogenesis protein [Marinobacter lutaoensis]|tara:strand:+ start:313 stop:999 length:687 start_codon:yes stop_codon:yes gene_type:complete